MPYSERQQHIAALIASRGNVSPVEFLLSLAREQREVDGTQWQDVVASDPQRFHMFIPQWNQRNSWLLFGVDADTHTAVLDFLTVSRDLLARKLVTILPDPKRHVRPSAIVSSLNPPSLSDRDQAALEIEALLQTSSEVLNLAIYTERIYALPSLSDFINNGFGSTPASTPLPTVATANTQHQWLKRLSTGVIALCILAALALLLQTFVDVQHLRNERQIISALHENTDMQYAAAAANHTIIHDTLKIRDTIVVAPSYTKKKHRRRVDLSE